MESTKETSAPAHPHNSFVILESFVQDALVYQPFVAEVRFEAGLNQRRGGLNRRATVARHLLSIIFIDHATCFQYASMTMTSTFVENDR